MKDCFQLLPLQSGIQLFTSQKGEKIKKVIDKRAVFMYNNSCVTKCDVQFYIGRDVVQIMEKYSRG